MAANRARKTKKELLADIAKLEDRIVKLENSEGDPTDADNAFFASITQDISEDSRDIYFRFQLKPAFACDFLSRSVVRVSGYRREEFYDDPDLFKRIIYKEDQTVLNNIINNPLKYIRRRPEIRWVHKKGGLYWTEIDYHVHEDNIEGVSYIQGIARDITYSKQSREQLKISRHRLIQVINANSLPTIIIDQNHRVLHWNKACETLTGLSAEVMIGTKDHWKPFYETQRPLLADLVLDKADNDVFNEFFEDEYRSSRLIDGAFEVSRFFPKLGGHGKWLFFSAAPLTDDDGKMIGAIETFQDVSEQKYAELALRGRVLFHQALIETIPNPIFYKDTSGRYIGCNKAFEVFVGKSKDVIIGGTPEVFATKKYVTLYNDKDRELMEKPGIQVYETGIRHADGAIHDVMMNKATFLQADGSVGGIVGVINDLTDHHRLESQLRQAQKMEAIGTLASGIAHDFNNILATILMNSELVLLETPDDFPNREELYQVIASTERAKDLVNQILTFSRQTQEKMQPVEVVPLIKESLKMMTASLPSTIEIKSSVAPDVGTVVGSPIQIQQIVMNLCNNAAYAMKRYGGTMSIALSAVTVTADDAPVVQDIPEGEYICLTVKDTGEGVNEKHEDRIFEPFFTTKPTGEGSGLGLSVVHGIVKQHGGAITYSSKAGHGTIFKVYLPRGDGEAFVLSDDEDVYPRGNATILIVDDEEALAAIVAKILTELDYHVIKETSSIEALVYIRNNYEKLDLVLTDLTMPRITGLELAERIHNIRADLPIVLCTGYNETGDISGLDAIGIVDILRKPFSFGDIARTIHKALNT